MVSYFSVFPFEIDGESAAGAEAFGGTGVPGVGEGGEEVDEEGLVAGGGVGCSLMALHEHFC